MKKTTLLFFFFLFSLSIYAQEKKVLNVLMKDGTAVCFYLSDKPLVTFVDDSVKIESTIEEAVIVRTLVERIDFLAAMPTAIEDIEEGTEEILRETFDMSGNAVSVSGLEKGNKVQVFSLNGMLLMSSVADDDGSVILSIDSLTPGIYIVNYNETTIKFIKR